MDGWTDGMMDRCKPVYPHTHIHRHTLLTMVKKTKIDSVVTSQGFWHIKDAVHLAVAGGVYVSVFLCCPFSHEMAWMRSLT